MPTFDQQSILHRTVNFKPSEHIDKGYKILNSNMGLFVGYSLITFLLLALGSIIPIVNIFIQGPLLAGFYLLAHKQIRGESSQLKDAFKAFDYTGNLVGLYFLKLIAFIILYTPFFIMADGFKTSFDIDDFSSTGSIIFLIIWSFVMFISLLLIYTSLIFAEQFIVFYNIGLIDAMRTSALIVRRHFGKIFGFILLLFLVNVLGAIVCGIGLLFSVPLTYCALQSAFGDFTGLYEEDSDHYKDISAHLID